MGPGQLARAAGAQQPTYPDAVALDVALDELRALPPLVTSWEIHALKQQLAEAQRGQALPAAGRRLRRDLRRLPLRRSSPTG